MLTRRAVRWIFVALALFYALTTNGRLLSPDAVLRTRAAENLILHGTPAVDPTGVPPGFLSRGRDGLFYPKYEAGPTLVALPFLALGAALERVAPPGSSAIFRGPLFLWYSPEDSATAWRFFGVALTNAMLVALLCALLYALLAELGWDRRAAAATTALAAFASPLWVYSRDLFAEPLAAVGLVLVLLAVERLARAPQGRTAAFAGFGFGLSVMARNAHLALLPIAALVAAHALAGVERARRPRLVGALCLGLAGPLTLIGWWNWLRFGALTSSGYGEELSQWVTPPLVGVSGLLLSPGRGLLTHFPLALLAVWCTPAAWRASRRTTLFAWGTLITLLAVYCRWHAWDGGWCWGPRFLVPAVPLLVNLCAPVWSAARGPRRWVGALLVATSAVIAFSGTLVAYTDFHQALRHAGGPVPYLEVARWSWAAYPPVAYWSFHPKVFYLAPTLLRTPAAWPLAAIFGGALAFLVPAGRHAWRVASWSAPGEPPRFRLGWKTGVAILLAAVAFGAVTAHSGKEPPAQANGSYNG